MTRRLTLLEIDGYDLVARHVAESVTVSEVPWLPPGVGGMTLGTRILLRHDGDRSGRRALLAHELVHAEQWANLGRMRFLRGYLRSYLANLWRERRHRAAYLAIDHEAKARRRTAEWVRRNDQPGEII